MHDLLSRNLIDIDQILTHRMPYTAFKEAHELALDGNCGKIVLEFEA